MAPDLAQVSRRISLACGSLVALVGTVAMLGWIVNSEPLKALYAGGIVIKTNTAVAQFGAGLALVLLLPEAASPWRRTLGRGLAVFVAAIGGLTLVQHVLGVDLGIDQLLFIEEAGAPATAAPNRMGPPAAIAFPLIGMALLLLDSRRPSGRVPSQALALGAMLIAIVPLLGYIFSVEQLYGIARFTGIALHTAVGFLLLGVGVIFSRPEVGLMRQLLANDSGGLLLRRMIPAAVLMPIVLGLLRTWGQDAGLYDNAFGRSLLVLNFIVVFSVLTWWTASAIQQHTQARARAEAAEHEMHARLMETLESERNARGMAERSNRMKDEFLATLSHELRTPLNAILGWVQLLVNGSLAPDDARRGLEAIERNSRLQAQLIEDLLDMSRIESGKARLDVQDVDLGLVIESALAAAAPSVAAKGLAIDRDVDPALGPVRGDPARLQQVLWNLISNAVKFTPAGGRILIALRRIADGVELSVSDTGIGIPPEFLGHVFDRFRQADGSTTRRYGGLGLGLSIARQLVELHGGSMSAASAGEGQGATFRVRLPAAAPILTELSAAPMPMSVDEAQAIQLAPQSLGGARVLVVDDQPDACELVLRILHERDARVTTATNVDQAIRLLEQGSFDVLVSDIGMPHRDGYDLIRHVRANHNGLPAIALTAFVRLEDEARVLAAGFDQHLAKPVSPERLVFAVASLARRSRRDDT